MKALYFDHAASTPVDPEVFRVMEPYFGEKFGNPGSAHAFGQEAIAAVDRSRETIAKALGAGFREVVFAGSATEANVLAIRGALAAARARFAGTDGGRPRLVVSAIEHESVLETARAAEQAGVEVIYLPVGGDGAIDEGALEKALDERTVLVSVQYANNEIGAVQPIARIAEAVRAFRSSRASRASGSAVSPYPLFHTDAAQAFQFLDCDVKKLGVDLMTLSAHKIYGPKGIGALYVRDAERILPIITGGGQEFGLRSGTENVPSIVGFAKAVELADATRETESKRVGALRDRLWEGIKKIVADAERNPPGIRTPPPARIPLLPNILNIYFPGREAQDLLTRLDLEGLSASSGSACRSRALEPSHVVEALGYPKARAKASIRLSLGRPTTEEDVEAALATFSRVCRNNKKGAI